MPHTVMIIAIYAAPAYSNAYLSYFIFNTFYSTSQAQDKVQRNDGKTVINLVSDAGTVLKE